MAHPALDKRAAAEETPETPVRTTRAILATLGTGAAWLLGIRAALLVVAFLVESSPLAEIVLGALLCDVAAGRAGLGWNDEDELPRAELWRRIGIGVGLGATVAIVSLGISVGLGHASATLTSPSTVALVGGVGAVALAIRDELLMRGLPILFARRAGLNVWWGVGFGALLSPSHFLLTQRLQIESVFLSIALGLLFARIAVELSGMWAAVSAHASWSVIVAVLAHGALFELSWKSGELAEGSMARGAPAVVGTVVAAIAAVLVGRIARLGSKPRVDLPESRPAKSKRTKKQDHKTKTPSGSAHSD